ncbi:Peptidase M28 [Dillenia turbinata]|uniref:Vacuolar membrane protease n=1 Tax=Dillenia turbinata TaxID=194707 RepID=A0AAN8V7Z9_9MAGN
MRQRTRGSSKEPKPAVKEQSNSSGVDNKNQRTDGLGIPKRSTQLILTLFLLVAYSSWGVFHYQFQSLPMPLRAEEAGKRGFSEEEAMEHVKALTKLGPHSVGTDALDLAVQYVLKASEEIKKTAHWEVDVQVDFFHAKSGANRLVSGLFMGKTLVYSDLNHVILRILPKYASEAGDNAILVSSHIDTVFSTDGAGDCSSCVAVMLELARAISHWAHGFKNSIIFLFNTGEEEGLNGAHSFITQHSWSSTIRMAIDLEAMGIGGQSSIFQAGPHPLAIENYAMVAKYPSGQIVAQDIFSAGIIKSATDFQVYKEVAGLSGLDFAFTDNGAVYHTKNDKLQLLRPGSLQHLGENVLAFLRQSASSSLLSGGGASDLHDKTAQDSAIYFDIMGYFMVVYRQHLANMLHYSVILQSALIWMTSLLMGGYPAAISLVLSCLSVMLMWILALTFAALAAFILPFISSSPVPYVANPWLTVGLFGAPAFLGALSGQHFGFLILQKYLSRSYSNRTKALSPSIRDDLAKLEAERWLYKSGIIQWLLLLLLGTYYKIGSSYIALVWLVSPSFAYGLLEATLSPARLPKQLKTATVLIAFSVPIIVSGGTLIRLAGAMIGMVVRFERNPGGSPEWLANAIIAAYIAMIICLTFVYLLSYVHLSGAKRPIVFASCMLFVLSVIAVASGIVPPFTEDYSRTVVHIVDTTQAYGEKQEPVSYLSLFSTTPGKLSKEAEHIKEGYLCGREKPIDFVTFSVKYGCQSYDDSRTGWSKTDIPTLGVVSDRKEQNRVTLVSIDTKVSTRWALAINTEHIEDFELQAWNAANAEELVPLGNKTSAYGWHIIQFSGGRHAPTRFDLTLFWVKNSSEVTRKFDGPDRNQQLLKLRTDVDRITPKAGKVLKKLPPWCSLFGKSTSPHTLAFLSSLPSVLEKNRGGNRGA